MVPVLAQAPKKKFPLLDLMDSGVPRCLELSGAPGPVNLLPLLPPLQATACSTILELGGHGAPTVHEIHAWGGVSPG
jgi:hypothetical protein